MLNEKIGTKYLLGNEDNETYLGKLNKLSLFTFVKKRKHKIDFESIPWHSNFSLHFSFTCVSIFSNQVIIVPFLR